MQKISNKREALIITVSGLLTAVLSFLSPVLAIYSAPIICPPLGNQCSLDEKGPLLFFIGSAMVAIVTGVLSLHYLAKLRLLTSIEASIVAFASSTTYAAFSSALWEPPAAAPPAILFWLTPVVFCISFIAHAYLFKSLAKRAIWIGLVASVVLTAIYFATPYALAGYFKDAHTARVDSEDLRAANSLPFAIYAPTESPQGYSLIYVNAILAYADIPTTYSITYSTHPLSQQGKAKSFGIEEQTFDEYSPPKRCNPYTQPPYNTPEERLGPCVKIGTTPQCDVYYQYPSSVGERKAFCKIDKTFIVLTADEDVLTQEAMVKVFQSFKTADAKVLQAESLRHR